ncbi:MAG: hypothetical protein DME19_18895 [Verrucomicrobia bacterium]|nr:MAG: hypothetical protein DME19_18895 [Verrucomicrobiota bacterium]
MKFFQAFQIDVWPIGDADDAKFAITPPSPKRNGRNPDVTRDSFRRPESDSRERIDIIVFHAATLDQMKD